MFERTPEREAEIEAIYNLMKPLGRGDTLIHERIMAVVKVQPHKAQWDHVVNEARKRLLANREIETWFLRGVGYRLLTVDEQVTQLPIWRKKKEVSQSKKTIKALAALQEEPLTLHYQRLRAIALDAARASKKTTSGGEEGARDALCVYEDTVVDF